MVRKKYKKRGGRLSFYSVPKNFKKIKGFIIVKSTFKKFLAIILGFLIFLFPSPRASAQIEVAEFRNSSRCIARLIRFTRADLSDMMRYCQSNILDKMKDKQASIEKNECAADCARCCASCDETSAGCCDGYHASGFSKSLVWGLALFGTGSAGCFGLFKALEEIAAASGSIAVIVIVSCIMVAIVVLYFTCACHECCCGGCSRCCAKAALDSFKVKGTSSLANALESLDKMSSLSRAVKSAASSGESQPLLPGSSQDIPENFLLYILDPDDAALTRLKFLTDRDPDVSQELKDNKFIGFIIGAIIHLREQGASISDRYCLNPQSFNPVRSVSAFPELDIQVVVDSGEDEGPNA